MKAPNRSNAKVTVLADFRKRWHREPAGIEAARIADAVTYLAALDARYLPFGADQAIRVLADSTPSGLRAYASLADDVLAAEATR